MCYNLKVFHALIFEGVWKHDFPLKYFKYQKSDLNMTENILFTYLCNFLYWNNDGIWLVHYERGTFNIVHTFSLCMQLDLETFRVKMGNEIKLGEFNLLGFGIGIF